MDLVRSWLGQALRATGAAVVVPVAVLLALSLTGLGGAGLGGLGSLSQIVSGPSVAGSDVSVDDGGSEIARAVTELASADTAGAADGGTALSLADRPGNRTVPGEPPQGRDGPPRASPNPPTRPREDGDRDEPPPPEPPPPPPPPPPRPVVDQVGDTVKDVTAGTPVAPTVEDAVDGLIETCGRLGCP